MTGTQLNNTSRRILASMVSSTWLWRDSTIGAISTCGKSERGAECLVSREMSGGRSTMGAAARSMMEAAARWMTEVAARWTTEVAEHSTMEAAGVSRILIKRTLRSILL